MKYVLRANSNQGVIYYMKDEFNNEAPYDFKNIQFYEFLQQIKIC